MPAPALHDQFETLEKQEHAGRLCMWAFLGNEVLLFAGLFVLYACYRTMYHADFLAAVEKNNIVLGTLNTVILITSSFTVALSIHAIRSGKKNRAVALIAVTLVFACVFLVVKGIEYAQHFREGIFPSHYYRGELHTNGAKLFFTIYFFATGLHALHVLIGMSVLTWAGIRTWKGRYTPEHHLGLELAGLYWHLVDLVWIFLWPLLYLAR